MLLADLLKDVLPKGTVRRAAGKEAALRLVGFPVSSKQVEEFRGEHDVAILGAGEGYALWAQKDSTEISPWESSSCT